MAYKCCGPTRY